MPESVSFAGKGGAYNGGTSTRPHSMGTFTDLKANILQTERDNL